MIQSAVDKQLGTFYRAGYPTLWNGSKVLFVIACAIESGEEGGRESKEALGRSKEERWAR